MASSSGESLAQESNISRSTEAGISVNLLLFGRTLVEKAFEVAMEEIQANNDNKVTLWMQIRLFYFVVICSSNYKPIELKFLVTPTEIRVLDKQVVFAKRLIS